MASGSALCWRKPNADLRAFLAYSCYCAKLWTAVHKYTSSLVCSACIRHSTLRAYLDGCHLHQSLHLSFLHCGKNYEILLPIKDAHKPKLESLRIRAILQAQTINACLLVSVIVPVPAAPRSLTSVFMRCRFPRVDSRVLVNTLPKVITLKQWRMLGDDKVLW